jgi:hypothetical protein
MQNPTEQAEDEGSIPTDETVRDGPNMNRTFTVRRKAAKRSERWYQNLSAPLSIPARKKPRVEEPLPTTTTDEAARKTISPDIPVGLPPPVADNDDANAEPVTDTQPNAGATRATALWTPEEVATLTSAVRVTCKKKYGKEYRIDWVAVAALVPGRTRDQCYKRWYNSSLDASIALTAGRTGKWTEDEDLKLKNSVQTHGGTNWAAIAALVPGRTKSQCHGRWHDVLGPSINRAKERTRTWTADEDIKLKISVQMHGGKNWAAIAVRVPGRTKKQCHDRWHMSLSHSIDRATARMGKWTGDEGIQLKNSECTVARIWPQLPHWFRVEQKICVMTDGGMSWFPTSTGRRDARVAGQQTKTSS